MDLFYTEIQKIVTRYCGEYLPYRLRESWGQLILAVLVSGSVVVNRLAGVQSHTLGRQAREKSLARQLKRLVKDERFNWTNLYAPLIKGLLKWNPTERVIIIMDETAHSDHFRLLMVGVWYEGRVIPVAWESWLGNTKLPAGVSYWHKVELVLSRAAQLIPTGQKVVVLADRAYGNPAFIDRVAKYGWDWLVRVQGQSCFEEESGWKGPLKQYLGGVGSQRKGVGRLFKKQGWREAKVVAVWQAEHKESLLLARRLNCEWEILELYKLRFGVEHLFRDYKSYGWQWESSQAKKLESCERQVLALAFVTLLVLVLGSSQVAQKLGKRSVFNLGRLRLQGYLMGRLQQKIVWEIAAFSSPVSLKKLLLV